MTIERYQGLELSLKRAVATIPCEYRSRYSQAYEWLLKDSGTIGPLPSSADTGLELKVNAQRGIHKPGGCPFALTVKSSAKAVYSADRIHYLDDGTWVFQYCQHTRNAGEVEASQVYNESLRACLRLGLPVGVFVKERAVGSDYLHLGLAFVEKYDSDLGMFWLRGPVAKEDDTTLSPYIEIDSSQTGSALDAHEEALLAEAYDDSDERDRAKAVIVRRKRQQEFRKMLLSAYEGRCTISRTDTEPALQAAHISSYLGERSQLVTNGLLLRADLHILYDRSLLSVDPSSMRVRISPKLEGSDYAHLDGEPIALPRNPHERPSEERLAAQYSDFVLANRIESPA